ncbi:MAG: MFS transporter [Legionellales bacterium]|nr:MFS transporter [Legionellales bacterium]
MESPRKHLPLACLIFALGASFYFYEFLLQVAPNLIVPQLMRAFATSATGFGSLTTFYFIAYAFMQLPGGALLDRYGPRYLLTISATLCGAGTLLFSLSQYLLVAQIARFLTGSGSAFAFIGTLVLVARWFPRRYFAFLSGLTITIGMLGAVSGVTFLEPLRQHLHWRQMLMVVGVAGLLLAFLIYCIVRDFAPGTNTSKHKTRNIQEIREGFAHLLSSKDSWLVAIFGGLMFSPTVALGASWGINYLVQIYGVTRLQAGEVISLIFIGWAVGSPVVGAVSDRMKRRKPTMYIAAVAGLAISFLIIVLGTYLNLIALAGLLFLFGFCCSGFISAFALIRELQAPRHSGVALGFMNMMNSLGGAFLPLVIGLILDLNWSGKSANMLRVYSAHNYQIAMLSLPVCFVVALLILPFIKETYASFQHNA